MMIGIIFSLASLLRAFVGCYNDGERRWAVRTMKTKQQQQREEDVNDKPSHPQTGRRDVEAASKQGDAH
jgi:hypothetical protein